MNVVTSSLQIAPGRQKSSQKDLYVRAKTLKTTVADCLHFPLLVYKQAWVVQVCLGAHRFLLEAMSLLPHLTICISRVCAFFFELAGLTIFFFFFFLLYPVGKLTFRENLNQNGKFPVLLEVSSYHGEEKRTPEFREWKGEISYSFKVPTNIGVLFSLYVNQKGTYIEVAQYALEGYVGSIEQMNSQRESFADNRGSFDLTVTVCHPGFFSHIEDMNVEAVKKDLQDENVLSVLHGVDEYGWSVSCSISFPVN